MCLDVRDVLARGYCRIARFSSSNYHTYRSIGVEPGVRGEAADRTPSLYGLAGTQPGAGIEIGSAYSHYSVVSTAAFLQI